MDIKTKAREYAEAHHETLFGKGLVHQSATEAIYQAGALWVLEEVERQIPKEEDCYAKEQYPAMWIGDIKKIIQKIRGNDAK